MSQFISFWGLSEPNKLKLAGPYLDSFVAKLCQVRTDSYSTNADKALLLLKTFVRNKTGAGFQITYKQQINSRICTVSVFDQHGQWEGSSGNIPTAICLAFVNKAKKPIQGLKTFKELYKKKKLGIYIGPTSCHLTQPELRELLNYEQ